MNINLSFSKQWLKHIMRVVDRLPSLSTLVPIVIILSIASIVWAYTNDLIVAYGDAESHLNIAKRVIDSITPGAAQFGGIWLPLPHAMMLPFIWYDPLWRTGLAGSIVSSLCYVVSCIFMYKLVYIVTKNKWASFLGALIFAGNPNILYLQATPMTEIPLLVFFIISTYYFVRFLQDDQELFSLIIAAFFAFCAAFSRYDGWALAAAEALVILLKFLPHRTMWAKMQGRFFLFSTLGFFGIFLWLLWNFLILGDPLYFTNSQFSAKSQQSNWLARGELPAYHNIIVSVWYYTITAMSNSGVVIFFLLIPGLYYFLKNFNYRNILIAMILLVPFAWYVLTLYVGQSVIFIPHITPTSFEWTLFNVRYGVMMVPVVAFFIAFFFFSSKPAIRALIIAALVLQYALFGIGYSKVITLADGTSGLSRAKRPDAEYWMKRNYDDGLVLMDDYARTMSILRSGIPMQKVIYIGNKPYWDISLKHPEQYATWVVMQKDDSVWKSLMNDPQRQGDLYKYFNKTYTSKDILIFKRNLAVPAGSK